ncbi:MAG: shikimate dehydrogenase [Betaproteobacteria bacterium]|nr:shikimate dehydrogenase [Betaproteobacteria bacterium]
MTDRYAVIGNPIAHSRSPEIHAAFARQTGQDLTYERILAPVDAFRAVVGEFRAQGGRGLNVTLPFKLEAHAYATRRTDRADAAEAVNTLRFDDAGILGDNTDGAGLARDLIQNLGIPLAGSRILLLGAGGAAQGVVLPLLEQSPGQLVIANRTVEKARRLATRFAQRGVVRACSFDELAGSAFDLVINATSATIGGESPALPAGLYAPGAVAYEMMYGKDDTPFLASAREQGASRCHDGLGMLVEQAAESFFLWRGVRPDTLPVLTTMRGGLVP